jgi:hypothetical protein
LVKLKRTKAFSYSHLNLRALSTLATLAQHVGVDLWHFETADGRSIRKAIDFLVPYLKSPPEPWPYQQIVKFDPAELAPILRAASLALPEPSYERIIAGMPGTEADRFQLLAPLPR